jgi:hypothetical protein
VKRSVRVALRLCLVLVALGTLLGQSAVVPRLAAEQAAAWPEVAQLRLPYTVVAVLVLGCLQVALVAVWALLSLVRDGEIVADRIVAWIDVVIAAVVVATALVSGVAGHLVLVVGAGGPGVVLGWAAALLGGATLALMLTVTRGLLRTATVVRAGVVEVT